MSNQSINTLDELYQAFEGLNSEGGWHRKFPALWPEPRANFLPTRWRYRDMKPVLNAAGDLVDTQFAERRNLTLRNPAEGNQYATVRTLVAAYQMIKPGETARAHRHTPAALRLILEGTGTYTVVNGERIEMCPGDVLLTPSMAWHSHESVGNEDCFWMDFLDVPLIHLLEPMFYEKHPNEFEADPVDVTDSPAAFRWEDTLRRLEDAAYQQDPQADKVIELGSPALTTIGLHMLALLSDSQSAVMQTTANSIFAVVRGKGSTCIEGETFDWEVGDTIAVPAWRRYQHTAKDDAVLLRVTDAPVFAKLNLLKTHVLASF